MIADVSVSFDTLLVNLVQFNHPCGRARPDRMLSSRHESEPITLLEIPFPPIEFKCDTLLNNIQSEENGIERLLESSRLIPRRFGQKLLVS